MSSNSRVKIRSFRGRVTTQELHSLICYIKQFEPDEDNLNNKWAQNRSGEIVKALGLVYSFGRCLHVLDQMIRFCDKLISIRNDLAPSPVGQHEIWTGGIDPVWPNDLSGEIIMTGGEQGDAIGHLGYCAKLILEEKEIWERQIAVGDVLGFGKTYRERAERYVEEAEKSMEHVLGRLLQLKDGVKFYFADDSPYKSGEAVPWNQIMMFTYALQNLASAHSILGNTDTADRYRTLVKTNIRWFLDEGVELYTNQRNHECYTWKYQYGRRTTEDSNHANLDIEGVYRAYIDDLGVARDEMRRFANTFVDQMIIADGTYAGRVDGTSDDSNKGKSTNVIRPGFLLLSEFREDAYDRMISANVKEGRPSTRFKDIARIMWLKQRKAKTEGGSESESEDDVVERCHDRAKICICQLSE